MPIRSKKLLRPPAPGRKHPLTGGAEAPTGRQTGRSGNAESNEAELKTEIDEAGRAKKNSALPGDFVSALFEIDGY